MIGTALKIAWTTFERNVGGQSDTISGKETSNGQKYVNSGVGKGPYVKTDKKAPIILTSVPLCRQRDIQYIQPQNAHSSGNIDRAKRIVDKIHKHEKEVKGLKGPKGFSCIGIHGAPTKFETAIQKEIRLIFTRGSNNLQVGEGFYIGLGKHGRTMAEFFGGKSAITTSSPGQIDTISLFHIWSKRPLNKMRIAVLDPSLFWRKLPWDEDPLLGPLKREFDGIANHISDILEEPSSTAWLQFASSPKNLPKLRATRFDRVNPSQFPTN